MRNALGILALVLVAAVGFAYYRDPSGCQKALNDVVAVVSSVTSKAPPDAGTSSPPPPAPPVVSAPPPPSPVAAPPPAPPAAPPVKPWTPPAVLPAQPNWTWTTSDGTTYQHVVVTKLGPDTVSITHSMGVAHDIPISSLPPEIQKLLNYDPVAAIAARKEARREEDHPYYAFADRAEAQNVARQLGWPLAWICTDLAALSLANPTADSEEDLSQRAISHLKSRTVMILVNGNGELAQLPPLILNQFFVLDDGPIPGGHHFYGPKIVLSDASITKTYGRITHTQLIASGDAAFEEGLASVPTDSTGSPPTNPAAEPTAPTPAPASVAATPPSTNAVTPWAPPAVIPAQPNWTWTTIDGTTYLNVVITKIEPDAVSITHSLGVAHIPIKMLPPDIQQQLNYHKP